MFFFSLLIIISIFLEGTVTTLPLTLVCLVCLTLYKKNAVVFLYAFLAGIFLDFLRVHTVGTSSLFFVTFVFLILLYQRKYEINSYPFVGFAGFLGSIGYLVIFGGGNLLMQSIIGSFIAILAFGISKKFQLFKTLSH